MDTPLIPAARYLDLCYLSGALRSVSGNVDATRERFAGDFVVDHAEVVERLARLRRDADNLRRLAGEIDIVVNGSRV